ncbi:cytochrome c [uncultured Abyssibacter sp.]|mgnify:FL=1|uniref:c-type cytochrome n=1 Tax=uncultured Abyssibacter sp. TaxID=2320202 RepID=UPI0032B10B6D
MTEPTNQRERETHEPEELHNPVPWPVAIVSLALIAWGASYYFQNTGYPAAAGDRRSTIVVDPNAQVDGAAVYAGNCASCHQPTGAGLGGVFPPLAGSEWVVSDNHDIPAQILLHGISGAIDVAGTTYNGIMPSFAQLSDAEIAAVLTHIRSSWGNGAAAISADQVATARKQHADRTTPWKGGEELLDSLGEP